jgi:hypothetical protein
LGTGTAAPRNREAAPKHQYDRGRQQGRDDAVVAGRTRDRQDSLRWGQDEGQNDLRTKEE